MSKPDYQAATFQAHRTFYFMTNKEYPVNTLQIVKKLPNTKLATYEEFANAIHQSVDFVSQEIGKNNDAFTLSRGEEFIIVYNSDLTTNIVERIRFSIAHELGHIILDHFTSGDLILTRGGLSEKRYKKLEKEADTFARELLAPTFLMQPGKWSIKQVCDIFDVSKKVAEISLNSKKKYPWIKPIYPLNLLFKDQEIRFNKRKNILNKRSRDYQSSNNKIFYLLSQPTFFYCENCHNIEKQYNGEICYCPICGKKRLEKIKETQYYIFHETKERFFLPYSTLKVDNEGRLIENCPICDNDHVSDNYCSVCGVTIINKCSGMHKTSDNWNNGYEESVPCEGTLLGSDRYCPKCGAESTFFYYELLKKWNIETQKFETSAITDISDDDLPF
ncbi:TPA: ImmA/IrrE family metallo-endopeptidase [Enterococcus faecium]